MSQSSDHFTTRDPVSAPALFDAAWAALVDMLGSATATTLLRRAIGKARHEQPALGELSIVRSGLEYQCVLPKTWSDEDREGIVELRILFRELESVLIDLTGPVVVNRLRGIPSLESARLFGGEKDT